MIKQVASIVAAAIIAIAPVSHAQSSGHKKADPKNEPTMPELVEYVRSALLTFSPADGVNDNLDVSFDDISKVLKITTPNGHCDLFLDSLNTNNTSWDEFDSSDSTGSRPELLRFTLVSLSGRPARTCYDKQNQADTTLTPNRARLLFSTRADEMPAFRDKLAKAFKKLIVLSGGEPEKKF
jgi:hypothetical protein